MIGFLRAAFVALLMLAAGPSYSAGPTSEIPEELRRIVAVLQPRSGEISLGAANATLDLGDDYDFYGGSDIEAIIVNLWGNPPGSAEGVLGIVMPKGASPLSEAWGAVITFEEVGYVSDEDAAEVDFDDILDELKDGTEASNEERRQAGYEAIHIIGWAENPKYNARTHSVVWAQNLKFEGSPVNTLNYDLRKLGRTGVLSVNFVSSMPELQSIRTAANDFAGHATFDEGWRYEDFNPETDEVAEFGIGGLVAAGVGVAAAKKLGLLALLAKFGKLIFVGIGIALVGGWKFIRRLFGRGDPE